MQSDFLTGSPQSRGPGGARRSVDGEHVGACSLWFRAQDSAVS